MKIGTTRNWVVLCGFALLIFSVADVNFSLAEEWIRVGERCIRNCDDQPVTSQNTRGQTSKGHVKVQEQAKVQEKVTVRRNVDEQTSETQRPVKP
jgi:hypothetical protein